MSDNIVKKTNSSENYYIDNLDDSELQARLYSEIYYETNIENESRTMDNSNTIKFNSMTTEANVKLKQSQYESEKHSLEQPSTSNTTKADSQKMSSTHQSEFVQVETLSSREMNPTCGWYDDKSRKDPSIIQGKQRKKNSPKKYRSSKHIKTVHKKSSEKDNDTFSKYNVVSKCIKQKAHLFLAEQMDKDKDSSDSEESILEVPIPPKPKPLLIHLQDSDDENNSNSDIDNNDLILKNWNSASLKTYSRKSLFRNDKRETVQDNPQDISSKSKGTATSNNKDTVNFGKSIQTSTLTQDLTEDITLNCTTIQSSTKSISEIKQLSKNTEVKQQSESTKSTSHNSKTTSPFSKNTWKGNKNANLQQETHVTSEKKLSTTKQIINKLSTNNVCNRYDLRGVEQNKSSAIGSCNPINNRKRRCNNEVDNQSEQKRQCIIEQNNQDVICSSTGAKNISNEFFEPMSEEMKNYYNLSRGQENFDIRELQQSMSKDPQMWTILDEDLMPCPSSRRVRFWNVKCTNCHQEGHRRYDCSSPRRPPTCYMCGMKDHTEVRCPQKMCLTCGKPQNTFRNTCEYCRVLYCTMCDSVGHEQNQCPDLWRRYHQTTDMNSMPQDPGFVMKRLRLQYCCNCAKRGHESSACREHRWSDNFPTPAAVTNYTDGPMYRPSSPHMSSYPEPNTSDFSLSETTQNETSIPQSTIDVQQTITEDVESSVDVNTLSNIDFYILPISQEVEHVSQTENDLKSSFILPTVETNFKHTKVNYVAFSKIIYSYDFYRNKNDNDARMILTTLDTLFSQTDKNFYMVKNLISHRTAPNFLEFLTLKAIKFEVKIGFIQNQKTLSLQLIAMKDYIEYLYDLLKHWLSLLEDEKKYGIDVNLPVNSVKMFNVLKGKYLQLNKMRFNHYADLIGGNDDPRLLYTFINLEKDKLKGYEQCKVSRRKYNSTRKKVFRLQTKLLIITNTVPEPNVYVRTFKDLMERYEAGHCQMNDKLDTATYLRLNLLYNQLFVPHTSQNINKMLHCIESEAKKLSNLQQQEFEICHVPLEKQQEPKIHDTSANEENLVCNSTVHTSSAIPHISLNIDSKNSYVINNQKNNEILDDAQNVNTSLEPSKMIDYEELTITIKNPIAQNSDCEIIPLNDAPVSPAKSKEPELNEGQLSTSEVVNFNVSENEQIIKTVCKSSNLSKKAKRKKMRAERLTNIHKLNDTLKNENLYDVALKLINRTHAFKSLHMKNAADEMRKRVKNRTIKPKHLRLLDKLIFVEESHQKIIKSVCNSLKK
ncbi:PREDICTED: uncharacterized protein LOC108776197 [Cyphomyrmex costatus]|uniref:uncharacterized protein LOC108776197 n=1 Tax=Cyphomyrmex costatus TaxID=456900 RepID=UPI0008521D5C|nr:PREDICTED: uncharacterized protein LOC108776197 [Cyphomyrmex costatus]XP_018398232.1 PREDICTED: uncharacterized protein LOC108776197 [Cyphomyrmex costatus]